VVEEVIRVLLGAIALPSKLLLLCNALANQSPSEFRYTVGARLCAKVYTYCTVRNRLHVVTNGFPRFFLAPLLPYGMFCTMLPNTPLTLRVWGARWVLGCKQLLTVLGCRFASSANEYPELSSASWGKG